LAQVRTPRLRRFRFRGRAPGAVAPPPEDDAEDGSVTIAGPVVYYLLGGEQAKAELDKFKGWLTVHNAAVMTVVLLILGVDLIAKGIPTLTS
jgi:hypothetical protein